MTRCRRDIARWTICFALVLCFHAAGAAALLARWHDDADDVSNAPVITVELAPLAVAPQTVQTDVPPGPQQSEAQPEPQPEKPLEKPEIKADPGKDAELSLTPPPKPSEKPKEHKPKQNHASVASTPSAAEQKAERAAAPAPGAHSRDPYALENWKSALVARLERYKRYPSDARARGEYGVAQLAFSVDRSGNVHNARIVHSSGSTALDRATIELVERAQPLPPPPDISHAQIAILVPIRYSMR